jgi:hypothetical protein
MLQLFSSIFEHTAVGRQQVSEKQHLCRDSAHDYLHIPVLLLSCHVVVQVKNDS